MDAFRDTDPDGVFRALADPAAGSCSTA